MILVVVTTASATGSGTGTAAAGTTSKLKCTGSHWHAGPGDFKVEHHAGISRATGTATGSGTSRTQA